MIETYQFLEKLKLLPFIEAIYLFGSRVNESYPKFADIDLAILCPTATIIEWQQILDIIENADTLLKIDYVRYDTLTDGRFKQEIDRTKKVIYERNRNL